MTRKSEIWRVLLFVTNIGQAKALSKTGARISHIGPKELFERADAELKFEGDLVSYMSRQGGIHILEEVPEMTDQEWEDFINQRVPPGYYWHRFFGQSPTAVYSVVVVTKPPL